jgi:protein gp37
VNRPGSPDLGKGPSDLLCAGEWLERIAEACERAGVACFVKQDSGPRPGMQGRIPDRLWKLKQFPNTKGRTDENS